MADKHTMRRSLSAPYCIPMDLQISEVVRYQHTHEDGSKEVAVSSADLLLNDTDSFILHKYDTSRYGGYSTCYQFGNLNKSNLWEDFIEELEKTCISKSDRVHKAHEKCETLYTVPVIGHKLFMPPAAHDDFELGAYHELRRAGLNGSSGVEKVSKTHMKKIKMNPNKFMFWEGKYYDATKVYKYKPELSNYLKPIGSLVAPAAAVLSPVHTPNGIIEFTKNVSYHDSQHHRQHQFCCINHQGQNDPCRSYYSNSGQVNGWTQDGAGDYLEINLGYPRLVTHIGSAGEFPATKIFPTRQIVGRRRIRRFRQDSENEEYLLADRGNGVRMSKFAQHVKILVDDEHSLSWVTSYEVHYRHTVTNKWVLLAVTSANSDAFNEHILDLSPYFNAKDGLFTQYLRVKPVGHKNKPCMRIALYGIDSTLCTRSADDHACGADEDSLISGACSDDVPTITYAIVQSSPKAGPYYVHDNLTNFYSTYDFYRYDKDDPKWRSTKRKNFQALMLDFRRSEDCAKVSNHPMDWY